jgi:uncharacterized protein
MTVVVDSNVFISALVFGGKPRRVLATADAGEFTLALSATIQEEVEEVLAEKFRWPPKRIHWACQPLWAIARLVKPSVRLQVADDPDDNDVLECALAAQASMIVTGDKDLLRLSPFRGIRILTPAQFLEQGHSPTP